MKDLTVTIPGYKRQMLHDATRECPVSDLIAELLKFTDDHYATLRNIQNGYGLTARPDDEDAETVLADLRENEQMRCSEVDDWTHTLKAIADILVAAEAIYDEVR